MAELADQVKDKINRALAERARDVASIAASSVGAADKERTVTQALLEHAQTSGLGFEWLGLVDKDLHIIAMSGDSKFSGLALQSPWVAKLLSQRSTDSPSFRLLPPNSTGQIGTLAQPWFLELAFPIRSDDKIEAVAVGITNWDWALSTIGPQKQRQRTYDDFELFIVANDGQVILAPSGRLLSMPQTKILQKAEKENVGWLVEPDTNGDEYVVGFSRATNHQFFNGVGLTVLVRQGTVAALAPLADLKRKILLYGLLFAAHATLLQYVLSRYLAAPLDRIAKAADKLRLTGDATIPHVTDFAETKALSESLICLVDELRRRENALTMLSTSLEAQVQDRTHALEQRNVLLAEASRKIESAIEAKSRFLAAASHDLRQPLQALNLFCVSLKRRVTDPEAATLVKNLEDSLGSLSAMLDKLVAYRTA